MAHVIKQLHARNAIRRERVFTDRKNPLDNLDDIDLIERYRLPGADILKIIDLVSADIDHPTNRSHALPPTLSVLITLRYLAKGVFFSEVADLHGVHKSSVSRTFSSTIEAICKNLPPVIFPTHPQSIVGIKEEFYKLSNFPNVVGCIDGTLIPIIKPSQDEAAYVCRKGYHALNVQAVCDANLRFTNAVIRWPGSAHDSFILNNSKLFNFMESKRIDRWLLGDSGYGCKSWLLTPIINPTSVNEERYNKAHIKTRNVIERCFGLCKSRYRCLNKTTGCLLFIPSKCVTVIKAVFLMHNYCIDRNIPIPEQQPQGLDVPVADNIDESIGDSDGFTTRRELIRQRFS